MREYNSGDCKCVQCGKATLHTKRISDAVRVRVCKKCEKTLPAAFWDGIVTVDARHIAMATKQTRRHMMSRTSLDFQYNGKEYSLRYNIDTLIKLGRSGLLAQIENGERPATMTRDLFFAAFEANHKDVPNSIRRKIYKEFFRSVEDGSLLSSMCEMLTGVCKMLTGVCKAMEGK